MVRYIAPYFLTIFIDWIFFDIIKDSLYSFQLFTVCYKVSLLFSMIRLRSLLGGLGSFFTVAFKFLAGHDIDDAEIDITHLKAGHFLDLAADVDLDAVEDGRCRRAVFKDGFDLDGRCCTVNGSGDALGGFGGGTKAGGKSAHERSFHVEDAVDIAAGNAGDLFDDGIVNDEGVVVLLRDGCLWLFAHTIRSFLIIRERDAIIS